jgi:hypothetical protein
MARKALSYGGPQYWLSVQRRFMAERGTTRAGYIAHYTTQAEERGATMDVQQIVDIHVADQAELRRLEAAAGTAY